MLFALKLAKEIILDIKSKFIQKAIKIINYMCNVYR